MNETIGAKGGHNDRKRVLRIQNKKKMKLEQEELIELEKKVKKQQKYTLVKTIPIIFFGGAVKLLLDSPEKERQLTLPEKEKRENKEHKEPIKKNDEVIKPEERFIIDPDTGKKIRVKLFYHDPVFITSDIKENKEEVRVEKTLEEKKEEQIEEKKEKTPDKEATVGIPIIEPIIDSFVRKDSDIDESTLSEEARATFQRLKAHKIIDVYENELKDIRYELRKIISEYNMLVGEEESIVYSEEAAQLLDKLSEVILKIEELKRRIQIEDIDRYDDNYIYTLIETYLAEFKDGKIVSDIKDSSLYVMIAEKLKELETKKDQFQTQVTDKKNHLEENEKYFDELRNKYYSAQKINEELAKFQKDQEALLQELQYKLEHAVSVEEKVRVEVEAMNEQTKKILRLLSLQMFLPGPIGAKRIATGAAAYLYFAKKIVHPKTITKRYKVITVKDYGDSIKDSLSAIDDASTLLGKTSKQVDKFIRDVEDLYQDYDRIMPEYEELLANLRKIKGDIQEKEYEMDRIKKEQKLLLEKNTAKVKTIGEYPM